MVRCKAHGVAAGSAVDLTAVVDLIPVSEAETTMDWVSDVIVSGTIASVGARLLEGTAHKQIAKFFDCFRQKLERSPNQPSRPNLSSMRGHQMRDDILAKAQQLRVEQAVFALATVVVARQPTSGTPGAHAIILPDGRVEGWIGGHCARPAVIRQSIEALAAGTPRLVIISPDIKEPTSPNGGIVKVPMLCAGQGELQVFVEPFLPRTSLVVIGESAVARALVASPPCWTSRCGPATRWRIWRTFPMRIALWLPSTRSNRN